MLFSNKLFNSIAYLLSFTNLQLVIPGRTWILLYLGRTMYKHLWACLALYLDMCREHRCLITCQKQHRQNEPAGQVDIPTRVEVNVTIDPVHMKGPQTSQHLSKIKQTV